MATGTHDGSGRRPGPDARVWALLVVLATAAVVLHQHLLSGLGVAGDGPSLGLPVLTLGFVLAVSVVVRLRTGRHGASFSPVEVPLVLGLFLATPTTTVLACVLGTGIVLGLVRRQSSLKLAFNLAHNALSATVAVCLWQAALGDAPAHSLRGTLAAVLAAVAMDLVSALSTSAAMALRDGTRGTRPVALARGSLTSCANAAFGLVVLDVLRVDPLGLWAVAGLAGFLVVAQRAHLALGRRHDDLQRSQEFVRRLGGDLALEAAVGEVLRAAREVLHADRAVLELTPGRGGVAGTWSCDADGVRPGPSTTPAGTPTLTVELLGEEGLLGTLAVQDREGDDAALRAADLGLLQALAAHAVVALRNGRLVDQLREQVVENLHQAAHDALTGLPNRLLFDRAAAAALVEGDCSVLLFDLDSFKEVNDTLGHAAGDAVLREIGGRLRGLGLRGQLPDVACTARLGGDEFAVVLVGGDLDDSWRAAERIRTAVAAPLEVAGVTLTVDASVGIALSPDHGRSVEQLLRSADVAMYAAKGTQIGISVYDATRDHHSAQRLALVADLRAGIADGQLHVVYQPKVATAGRHVVGVEALVRWKHPVRGTIPPDEFIGVAERTGLVGPLTDVVLDLALAQCRQWQDQGLDLGVAVNVSVRTLHDTTFPDHLARLLRLAGVRPSLLTLEITEGALMTDPERAVDVLHRLRKAGVRLSVDDLGVGHSSLAYLKRLPVDEVKVDRSFVTGLAGSRDDQAIVRALVEMVHQLGRTVVAEGVEDEQTLSVLANLGADTAQGYWMSRPVPADEVAPWVRRWNGSACDVPQPRRSLQPVTGTAWPPARAAQ